MGPHIFYRVEDEHSRACYIDGEGIIAEDTDTWVDFRKKGVALLHQIAQHLDWSNREPTPFISTYSEEQVAQREAERRVMAGKRDVRIYKINMRAGNERTEYRNIRLLAEKLDFVIPKNAWNNSMYEYVFLSRIPDSAVIGMDDLGISARP
jgi:molybdate-binding protein